METTNTEITVLMVEAEEEKGPMLAHNVFILAQGQLSRSEKPAGQACSKHPSKHEGEVFFAVGTLAEDLQRGVNDRDFDVALHIFFKDNKATACLLVVETRKKQRKLAPSPSSRAILSRR